MRSLRTNSPRVGQVAITCTCLVRSLSLSGHTYGPVGQENVSACPGQIFPLHLSSCSPLHTEPAIMADCITCVIPLRNQPIYASKLNSIHVASYPTVYNRLTTLSYIAITYVVTYHRLANQAAESRIRKWQQTELY